MAKSKQALVTVLVGEDTVSKDTFLEDWIGQWVPTETRSFNLNLLDGDEVAGEEIVTRCLALPMISEHRAVVVRHAGKVRASNLAAIAGYVKNPSPSTGLVLECDTMDRRQKSWQTILKVATVVECKVPYPDKIVPWIAQRCRDRYKRRIDRAAAQLLQDCVGNNLAELDAELNKIDIFVPKGAMISVETVEELVGARADDVFKWLNAVGQRNTAKALKIIDGIMETDRNAVGSLALLAKHFYTLLQIKLLQEKRMNEREIAASLGLNLFFHFTKLKFGQQARSFSAAEIEHILEQIVHTDKAVKSSGGNTRLLLESLVFAICRSLSPV